MVDKKEYILFLAQMSNFESQTMLIPKTLLTPLRKQQFDELRSHAEKLSENTFRFVLKYKQINSSTFMQVSHPMVYFINEFCKYASGRHDDLVDDEEGEEFSIRTEEDKSWYNKTLRNIISGHDHIANFNECMHMTHCREGDELDVVEGFLILEDFPEWDRTWKAENNIDMWAV